MSLEMMRDYLTLELCSIKEFLLGVGIAFSIATTLRLDGLPVGVGEILLLLWSVIAWSTGKRPQPGNRIYLITVLVVGISLLLLLLGAIYNHVYEVSELSVRTALAHLFSWGLLWVLVQQRELDVRNIFGWVIGGFILSVIIAMYLGPLHGGYHIDILWSDKIPARYWENLSENRNQFALLVLIIPYIVMVFSDNKEALLSKLVPIVIVALVLAVLVRSDALWLGWLVGGGATFFFSLKRARYAGSRERNSLLLGSVLLLSAVCVVGYKFWFVSVISDFQDAKTKTPKTGVVITDRADVTQAKARVELLKNGLQAIKLSPLVGFGPGFHSGDNGPFDGREAHNTLIDWATQAGLLGGLVLLAYWLWVLRYVFKYGDTILIGLIVALGVFSCFHYTLRQPLFWLIPGLVLLYCSRNEERDGGKFAEN
jgi:hypothetical protein